MEETNELMRVLRDYGLYRDEHKDFCEEMQRLRVLRGKAKERWDKEYMIEIKYQSQTRMLFYNYCHPKLA